MFDEWVDDKRKGAYAKKMKIKKDDRLKRVFVDINDLRLPMSMTVCALCGLLQRVKNKKCVYCGEEFAAVIISFIKMQPN
jgi:hypothetical protein